MNPTQDRRRFVELLLAGGATVSVAGCTPPTPDAPDLRNPLLWAAAWRETAAEFGALCHQAYNLARLRVELAIARRASADRPLAVITDVDDTIFHASSYWGHLIDERRDFFDDALWDEWLTNDLFTAVPGALDFLNFCRENDVAVFYVTNRDQGERTHEHALRQLRALGFPYADDQHLTVYRETSDKTPTRESVAASHQVVVILGDNLNDYKRDYYVADVDERYAIMARDKKDYGDRFILLPNPTDGHWVRAIFGESEPAATDLNRERLNEAATRSAWRGNRV